MLRCWLPEYPLTLVQGDYEFVNRLFMLAKRDESILYIAICDENGHCSSSWSVPGQECPPGQTWNSSQGQCVSTGFSSGDSSDEEVVSGCASHTGGAWLLSLLLAALVLGRRRRRA